jgi:phosphatidyl-myo-inositol dimannoside synthase
VSVRSLLLAPSFPPAAGGMETLLYQTARRLAAPPLVVAPAPAMVPDVHLRAVATTPRSLVGRASYRAAWAVHPALHYTAAWWRATVGALASHRPRVLLAGHVYLAPLAWLVARRAGLPFVVFAYGQEVWRPSCGGRRVGLDPVDELLRGGALRAADRVLVLGRFGAGLVCAWGVAPERVVPVPFGAAWPPAAPPPAGTTLLSVCRLVPRKGVDTVIRALPRLVARFPTLEYRVVGEGPDRPRLARLAETEGVAAHVRFLGRLADAALAREYASCALFVQPSRRTADGELEGLGLVYFEAAAWGRPVVAGVSGGEPDAVLDGATGVLVDGSSVDAVAHAIEGLLADPSRLVELGQAGRRRVETTHNWCAAARRVDALLDELAAGW